VTQIEKVRPLDLLDRLCRLHGWALILTGSHDHPEPPSHGPTRWTTRDTSHHDTLAIVQVPEPPLGYPEQARSRRILRALSGFDDGLICRLEVDDDLPLDMAAHMIAEALVRNGYLDGDPR